MNLFKSWKSHFHALLLHPTEAKVLLQTNCNQYFLPSVEINQRIKSHNFEPIKAAIAKKLGIIVNVLHYASYQVKKEQRKVQGIYVLEQYKANQEIRTGVWCDRSTLEGLSFTIPSHKSIIDKYLIELETDDIPPWRPPWSQPGWFHEVSIWIETQLKILGYKQISPIKYVKSRSISCILSVETTRGVLFFKESPTYLPLFCDEPKVTTALTDLFPQNMPSVISIDNQHHWMLLADFGKPIGNKTSSKMRQEICRLLAQIQIQSVKYCDRLFAAGCLDRRLDVLKTQIEPLIQDKDALSELSSTEIERLKSLVPILKNLCDKLANYKIPETLVHGDLHLYNVALHEGNYIFFDWTDGCISYPFFDLFLLSRENNQRSLKMWLYGLLTRKSREHEWDQYLSQWEHYEPKERLLDAWKIARPLAALHYAVTLQSMRHILRKEEEVNSTVPYFLRYVINYRWY